MFKMLSPFLRLYQPEPAQPLLTDPEVVRQQYVYWRWRMFVGFFLGYAILYFCRKNISNAMPIMAKDLGYSNLQLGIIGTTLYITYGLGKFLNGIMADRSNIRVFMATALITSGLLNILFGMSHSLWVLAFCWGLNGWFQSMGFPPIARGMTLWYEPDKKATRWAFWTCSHQAGTALVMGLTAWILVWGTWRYCFYLPGGLCILFGIFLLFWLGDTPAARGLPPVTAFKGDLTEDGRPDNYWQLFFRHVIANRNVWVIGIIDLCVYVIRYGTLDWSTKFMIEYKGYEHVKAASMAGFMPLAGIAGVLGSGLISDALFRGRYKVVNAISLALLGLFMYGFLKIGSNHLYLDIFFLFGIGFFVEGPQSILGGVGAVDAGGSAKVASAAAGLVGILAYFGASLSGIGSGYAIDRFGWSGAFYFWIACSLVGLGLCLFAWKEERV